MPGLTKQPRFITEVPGAGGRAPQPEEVDRLTADPVLLPGAEPDTPRNPYDFSDIPLPDDATQTSDTAPSVGAPATDDPWASLRAMIGKGRTFTAENDDCDTRIFAIKPPKLKRLMEIGESAAKIQTSGDTAGFFAVMAGIASRVLRTSTDDGKGWRPATAEECMEFFDLEEVSAVIGEATGFQPTPEGEV